MIMILTSMPIHSLAANVDHNKLSRYKNEIINNKTPVKVAKPEEGKTAADLIKNQDQPAIYTLRTDYKVQRGEKYKVNYQPYIASVGAAASDEQKAKVNRTIKLPVISGYIEPQDDFKIDYNTIKDAADVKNQTGNDTNGIRYQANRDFRYKAKSNQIKIKHVFQDLEDFNKYTNPDGSIGDEKALFTTQNGNTGSTMEVSPLDKNDPRVKGFVPEADSITMRVPEKAKNFILEYRYNRAHYDVKFDTAGGTEIPNRNLYYEQVVPTIEPASIPTKLGCEFLGWKPSVGLKGKLNSKNAEFKNGEIIKDSKGNAIVDLHNTIYQKEGDNFVKDEKGDLKPIKYGDTISLNMPASEVTFTAVWKDKEKADYAVQFWAEKADHADGASLADKYDYIGTRVYKDQNTGSRPNLDKVSVKDIVFPDLDQDRLNKIWDGEKSNSGRNTYLNKFYVYNQALTNDQNKDPKNVNLVKSVDSTGKTVYNIYYDRQVYNLYFTKSNVAGSSFYPEISKDGKEVGKEGNPYHFKARYNQNMVGLWPDDVKEVRGFDEGNNSLGWLPNLKKPKHYYYRDTPPYRLSANLFIDCPDLEKQGGYVSKIDLGNGKTEPASITDLSFGIDQNEQTMPHHIDFWLDDFDGEQVIDYDLYTIKSDTNNSKYTGFLLPDLQGFTPKNSGGRGSEFKDSYDLDSLNDEREEVTPFPEVYSKELDEDGEPKQKGKLYFMKNFPGDNREFDQNGYLKFEYSRNKYPLRFNYDPSKIKGDKEFNSTNQLQTFYEFPLKALSPKLKDNEEYKKDNPANLLDNPEKLKELGLTDLVFADADGKLKVKRPDNLSNQMVFKGWALDPAGTKLIWENPGEKMPSHPVNLYAKWGEPDHQWKVTFDPNGGNLRSIDETKVTKERKTIQVGDRGQEEKKTFAKKEANDGDKQVFTVIQRQKLVEPEIKPTRKGYDFMGWEVIRYMKNPTTGDYTNEQDTSYRDKYKVPELYSFGNDVVAPVYLKAIWVPNDRLDVKVEHYILDKDYMLKKKLEDTLEDKRANYLVATTGDKQGDKYILATDKELEAHKDTSDVYSIYKDYNNRVNADNTFFQQFRVEPAQILNTETNKIEDNPKVTNNVFKFFYKPFRSREYKVNYIDERFKGKETQEGAAIIDQELVSNGNRHYDARNYRPIPGWVLADKEKPQQQLFFDVDEDTNALKGINGTGKDEITFYYKDVRVIETKKDDPVPDGYVRVTFKAEKGGSFGKDKDGKDITELHYDVIKGIKSDLLPVPKELAEGETVDPDKHYITPETGRKFTKWDNSRLLNKNTIIDENHTFTAYFEWSGLSASGLVRTEAFKDPENKWTNNFAPKIEDLKKQLVWKEKDEVKKLPEGTKISLFDNAGIELTSDEQVFALVNEKKAADKDELVRTVNVKAKVTFTNGKDPQELTIPITVYKNVYEALNKDGDKPLFLKEAEGKEAKDGGLKEILKGNTENRYIKVTIKPNKDFTNKDDKVYYVNPNAWVEIPEVKNDGDSNFTNWTADIAEQNEEAKENGIFNFTKRHKFTKDAIITPVGSGDVVEQEKGKDKPDVPKTYVKVIVKTTDKATDDTKFEKTFWVNPTKVVNLGVANPTGKEKQKVTIEGLGEKEVNYVFKEWQKVQAGKADDSLTDVKPAVEIDLAKNKFTDKVTVIEAVYYERFAATPIVKPIKTTKLDTPQGKEITDEILKGKITPQKGKEILSIEVISKPDGNTVGDKQEAKVIVKYKDGTTQGTNDKPVIIPVEVHKNIIPEAPGGKKPADALENYVKVTFNAGTGGTVSGNLVYYVSPEVEVDMTKSAESVTKTPSVGYTSNGGTWSPEIKSEKITAEKTYVFNFVKSEDIVEKSNDPNQVIPAGYVKVTFKTENESKGKLDGNVKEKIYYVNPKAEIKLVELTDGKTAGEKQLAVPKTAPATNYLFDKWYEEIDTETAITSERIYVAKFKLAKVKLTYEAGEGARGTVPAVVTVDHGTSVRLARPEGLSKENATFAGWKIGEKTYKVGDEVTLNENTTATAQWTTSKHTVTFNTMGGSNVPSQEVEYGKKLTKVATPTLNGKVFMGWKEQGKEKEEAYFDLNSPINENKTLIAIWQNPVQKIGENDPVEEQFIKVTFLKGEHGTLKEGKTENIDKVTYKVAKGLSFEEAKGLIVPKIVPAKYYKAKAENSGWDKALKLEGKEITFIAQYEPQADVIPVDPSKSDEDIKKEKPEGMVLVEFKVPADKAYMLGNRKFYVKANTEVEITPPLVVKTDEKYDFKGWDIDEETKKVTGKFEKDTEINSGETEAPNITVQVPRAGASFVEITKLTDEARGHFVLTRGGQEYNFTSTTMTLKTRVRRRIVEREITCFDLSNQNLKLQANDKISVYATKGNLQSDTREYTIR